MLRRFDKVRDLQTSGYLFTFILMEIEAEWEKQSLHISHTQASTINELK